MTTKPEPAPEKILAGFLQLVKTQPFLFQKPEQLWELSNNLTDDIDTMAQQIKTWCETQRTIANILKAELTSRGQSSSIPKSNPKEYNEQLKNAIRKSFPPTNSQQYDTKNG